MVRVRKDEGEHDRRSCLRWFACPFVGCRVVFTCFTVSNQMLDHTETLRVGARTPEFSLEAANRDGILTLSGFLKRGLLIVEFLRGTW